MEITECEKQDLDSKRFDEVKEIIYNLRSVINKKDGISCIRALSLTIVRLILMYPDVEQFVVLKDCIESIVGEFNDSKNQSVH